ncbi:MAG: hypothetical protein MI807_19745 [Verrucomicrobiales bacterium]|nr:hypothetical protein [Verrucomicrobiales bacterium]
MKRLATLLTCLFLTALSFAEKPETETPPLIEDSFDREELGKGWTTQTGEWKIVDGALRGKEIKADKHSAAARRVVETKDAVYQLRFRLSEGSKGFHFGFDPKRGSLDKKGHLFSVIVTPASWRILKHVDKNRREEDPNEILATASQTFEPGTWYSLTVVTKGTKVDAMIEGIAPLTSEHPTFGVPKPTLVFRVIGDAVDVDDITVSAIKP